MVNHFIKFIGIGSCFNTKMGNTAAYRYDKKKKHLLLIDCGETVFSEIRYSDFLTEAESVDILITHLHSDHAGSLESLIFYCAYVKNVVPTIIFPEPSIMLDYLSRISSKLYTIQTPDEYTHYSISHIPQKHAPKLPAYGYMITYGKHRFFYSGDSQFLPHEIVLQLIDGTVSRIYQDVEMKLGGIHMNLLNLAAIIPNEFRRHVTCMHFDSRETMVRAQEMNFNVAKKSYIKKV